VDYRIVNLRTSVQSETHQKRSMCGTTAWRRSGVERLTIEPTAFALVFLNLSCAGRSSSSLSSSRTVRLSVGERRKCEIVIWSPQRQKAASIARFGSWCSRSSATTQTRPQFVLFPRKSNFYVSFILFNVYTNGFVATTGYLRFQLSSLKAIRHRIVTVI
jgi:hypothetical protein